MRIKTKLGIGAFIIGLVLTAFGSLTYWSVKADTLSDQTIEAVKVSFYIGISLIVISAILFILASASSGKE